MNENCKDCPYIKEVDRRLTIVEEDVRLLNTGQAELKVETKTIFNILNEIKNNIQKIADKIENIQLKPTTIAEKYKIAAITAIISTVVGFLVARLF